RTDLRRHYGTVRGQLGQFATQFGQLGWLAQNPIYMLWILIVRHQAYAPARKQDDWRPGRALLDRGSDLSAIHVRHAKIGDHHLEWLAKLLSGDERVDARFSTVRGRHPVTIAFEDCAHRMNDDGIIVHDEHPKRPGRPRELLSRVRRRLGFSGRKYEPDGRTCIQTAFNFDFRAMSLCHAIDHGEAQPGAAFSLRRKERLETPAPGFFIHAGTGVADLQYDIRSRCTGLRSSGIHSNGY